MQKYLDRLSDAKAMEFIGKLEKYFKNLPHLPKDFKELLVSAAPWFAIIGAVLSAIGVFQSLNSAFRTSYWLEVAGMSSFRGYFIVIAIYQAVSAVLLYYAYKPLKARKLLGWVYMFWLMIFGLVITAVGLVFNASSLVWTVIGTAIGFYVLYELKPFYSKKGELEKDLDPDNPNSK